MKLKTVKKILLHVFLILSVMHCQACKAETGEQRNTESLADTVACLKIMPSESDSVEKWRSYFDCFPDNYELFMKVFGYKKVGNELVTAPLYHDSHIYILEGFYKSKTHIDLSESEFAEKVIDIAVTATEWEADAPSALQLVIHSELKQSANTYFEVLSQRSGDQIEVFWKFIFDGPHGVKLKDTYCRDDASSKACQVLAEMMK